MIWSVECKYIYWKCLQTLHCSWHEERLIARHALTNVTDCLMQKPPGERRHTVADPLRDFPLTWRNTQVQINWLWKWLKSYSNCTFSRWKDWCLFNLLFWIPNSFCTFHDYGRGGTASLASPDDTSLRRSILRNWFVTSVLSLPTHVVQPHTAL